MAKRHGKKKIDLAFNPSHSGLYWPTLVLNKNWVACDSMAAKDAMKIVSKEHARIVLPSTYELYDMRSWIDLPVEHGEECIQYVRKPIKIPKLIVTNNKKMPKREVVFSRRNLWKRDGYACQFCGKHPAPDEITVDHVVPKSRGGLSSFENCVLACVSCNMKKDNRTPEEAGMRLQRTVKSKNGVVSVEYYHRPVKPSWSPYYALQRRVPPPEWKLFLQEIVEDLYWNIELES